MPTDDRYPDDWPIISERIRERAEWRCEQCGAPNRTYIQRNKTDPAIWRRAAPTNQEEPDWHRPIKIVLTVHHIGVPKPDGSPGDPDDKTDNRDENLTALCQRCHLRADTELRVRNARRTRDRKQRESALFAGQGELFPRKDIP